MFNSASSVSIPTPPALGLTIVQGYKFEEKVKDYSKNVQSRNNICMDIIHLAIENHDKKNAIKALNMMLADRIIKSHVSVNIDKDGGCQFIEKYTIVSNNESIIEAKKLIKVSKF